MSQPHPTYEDWSISLTKTCLILLFLASILLMCTGTWVVDLVIIYPSPLLQGDTRYLTLLIFGYLLGFLALIFLFHLYQLVARIGKNQVFVAENVRSLQVLGWEMALATLISFGLGVTCYVPMLLITVAGLALTLVIRVVRNAFGKAVELQDEVDYTI
ncbi:DUF2975 domain-containing protein [Streptococcus sp. A34]|uniref:DUF2975 domain-containing protein n=1 Tax=Streptococcus TaxID=1301 RepID=UPI000CF53834|nr:DUF2975 domain-containing protein [Streptococcus suis]NQM37475.1 DUF2975 domain-containing protein [Streptococcus suis]UUM61199.1 DUF2975 domain-containing protein [Streptococcus suis]